MNADYELACWYGFAVPSFGENAGKPAPVNWALPDDKEPKYMSDSACGLLVLLSFYAPPRDLKTDCCGISQLRLSLTILASLWCSKLSRSILSYLLICFCWVIWSVISIDMPLILVCYMKCGWLKLLFYFGVNAKLDWPYGAESLVSESKLVCSFVDRSPAVCSFYRLKTPSGLWVFICVFYLNLIGLISSTECVNGLGTYEKSLFWLFDMFSSLSNSAWYL